MENKQGKWFCSVYPVLITWVQREERLAETVNLHHYTAKGICTDFKFDIV